MVAIEMIQSAIDLLAVEINAAIRKMDVHRRILKMAA